MLDQADNVGVALADLAPGELLLPGGGVVADAIPRGHKVALADVPLGGHVVKYGHVIGEASAPIEVGQHVHTHNLMFGAHDKPRASAAAGQELPAIEAPIRTTFKGIRRSDGSAGTRNYIAVLASVNCSATVTRAVSAQVEKLDLLAQFPNVDGVIPLVHDLGCGMAPTGEGVAILQRTMAGYAAHPNIGGLLLIGLGCEVNQIDQLTLGLKLREDLPVSRMTIQDQGGTRATVDHAVAEIRRILPEVNQVERTEVPVSELTLGLNCGGSDGWSGVTANPALGYASDLLVSLGGTSVLAETPEIYGAEDLLVHRASSPAVAQELLDIIDWWESYTDTLGASMDNNPSPGNKEGGITTILEKSLGAVAKGGHAPMGHVYRYAEHIKPRSGFGFMDTPGYDPVSVTGLIAGGANIICFTTGRGSALGTRPAPTLKVATNSEIARRMQDDMDINAGEIVDAGVTIAEKGLEIYNALLDLASGVRSKSEQLGYGDDEFIPWHIGAVM